MPLDELTRVADHSYIRESMAVPLLERENELELARAWREKGDERALHTLVEAYARLAVSVAARFRHYGLPIADLIQEGNIGLMQAAARFDPERDVRFSTYAMWWIRASVQDFVLRNWSIVRTGTTSAHKALFFNLRRLRGRIAGLTGEDNLTEASRAKIATELGVSIEDVRLMEQRLSPDQSLQAPISEDGEGSWGDFLPDDRPNPEEATINHKDAQVRSKWLQEALKNLPEREQIIIRERHLAEDAVTLEDLGRSLHLSKERVRQLETRAMQKLRHSLAARLEERGAAF